MAMMPAVLLDDQRRIVLEDRQEPVPRADQVLVDVDLCGICGSDLHSPDLPQVYRGGFVLGHEMSGRVAQVGAEVSGWAVGDRVALNPNGNVCGFCEHCRAGRPNFCHQATMETALGLQADGGLAPSVVVSPKTLRRIPPGTGRVEAAWVEPTATALRALRQAGDIAGATVLVSGGGPIGQLACRLAADGHAGRILLVEPAPERRAFAAASHVDDALTPDEAAGSVRPDVVLECSGSAGATTLALDALRPGGVLVVVGAGPGSGLDPVRILLKEITVRGSFTYADEFDEAIDLLADGRIAVADLTTEVAPIAAALSAFEALRAARTMKILIDPHG
ncbi:zinc-binding dehydrogenase [Kutzneria sp. NPDC052558]|uniref:zinc-binding dehydrogenase n=1 Tax=Kutzneria sp. NPDC052558 TaxID=3364121 RepID=UPI0037CB3EB8